MTSENKIFIDSKGKIHLYYYIKIVFHTTGSLLQRRTNYPIYFQGDEPSQLDMEGLPPTQGRNLRLMADFAIKKLDLL